jgi:hypothetical protein
MEAMVNGIPVHYPEHGTGTSVLALHGGGVDHREIMGALEPLFAGRPEFRFLVNQKPVKTYQVSSGARAVPIDVPLTSGARLLIRVITHEVGQGADDPAG